MTLGAYVPGYSSSGLMGLMRHMSPVTLLVPVKSIALRHRKLDATLARISLRDRSRRLGEQCGFKHPTQMMTFQHHGRHFFSPPEAD